MAHTLSRGHRRACRSRYSNSETFVRADAGDRELLGDARGRSRVTSSSVVVVERGDRLVRVDVLRRTRPSGRPRGGRPRWCSRTPARAGRPRRRGRARPPPRSGRRSRSSSTISRMRVVGLDALAGLQARRELEDRHVGEGVVDRVDRVGEPALLADLVEQARAHRAAQQRRVDAQRGALRRGRAGRSTAGRTCAGATGWSRAPRPASCGANAGAGSKPPLGEIDGKRPNDSASSPSSGTCSRLPTRNAPPREPAHWRAAEGDDRRRA